YSKVIPGIASTGDVVFGIPLLVRGLEALIFPGVPASDIYLHPIARAAWVGVLATALNLMPIGQLDGGHILYAVAGPLWHRNLTLLFIACLIPCGLLFSWTWLFWAAILAILARRHPRIYDNTVIGSGRMRLSLLSLVIFVLSFSFTPIRI
ncbi:MAG: site-2 protease family protein, partial [Bryobacteraceae bacterium]|nr:site-2 protease family protein [Bryobacteraceae bacterium]